MTSVNRQNGVALVLVLWVTVMLTIMAGAFSLTLQREAKLIGNLKAKSEAAAFAEAGLNYALLMLTLKDRENSWKADGSLHEVPFSDGLVTVKIADETGKIDLNLARRELLVKMFTSVAVELSDADKLADAILDWRDANDDVQLNGAEIQEYKRQNLAYGPRNALFQSVEELQFVLGISPKLYKIVEPMLTVYSGRGEVDKTKASPEVLRVLKAMAEDGFGSQRANIGSQSDTLGNDDGGGEQTDSESGTDGDAGNDASDSSSEPVFTEGGVYSFDIAALLPGGHTGHIKTVVRPGGNGAALYEVLSWKQVTARNVPAPLQNSIGDASYFNIYQ